MARDSKRDKGHAQRTSEIDLNTVKVQFSENVTRGLSRIEAAVHDSTHFDGDLLENLQGLLSGKPIPLDYALSEVALLTTETMKHIHATGDERAKKALDDFLDQIMTPIGKEPKTITLIRTPGRLR